MSNIAPVSITGGSHNANTNSQPQAQNSSTKRTQTVSCAALSNFKPNPNGNGLLHQIILARRDKVFDKTAMLMTEDQLERAFQPNKDGKTPFHLVMESGDLNLANTLSRILPTLSVKTQLACIQTDKSGVSPLLTACQKEVQFKRCCALMVASLHKETRQSFLSTSAGFITWHMLWDKAEHDAATYRGLLKILTGLSTELRVKILSSGPRGNVFHRAVFNNSWAKLQELKNCLSNDEIGQLLLQPLNNWNPVQLLMLKKPSKDMVSVFRALLEGLESKDLEQLLQPNSEGRSLFHLAALGGNIRLVRELLGDQTVAKLMAQDKNLSLSLAHMVQQKGVQCFADLYGLFTTAQLKRGLWLGDGGEQLFAALLSKRDSGMNHLFIAAMDNDVLKSLAQKEHRGTTLTNWLVSSGAEGTLKYLLKNFPKEPCLALTRVDSAGMSCLHYQALMGHKHTRDFLFSQMDEKQVVAAMRPDISGMVPLHYALQTGGNQAAFWTELILKYKGQVLKDCVREGSWGGLYHLVARSSEVALFDHCDKLYAEAAVPSKRYLTHVAADGTTPLMLAVVSRSQSAFEYLCKQPPTDELARCLLHTVGGSTPLSIALTSGFAIESLLKLLDHLPADPITLGTALGRAGFCSYYPEIYKFLSLKLGGADKIYPAILANHVLYGNPTGSQAPQYIESVKDPFVQAVFVDNPLKMLNEYPLLVKLFTENEKSLLGHWDAGQLDLRTQKYLHYRTLVLKALCAQKIAGSSVDPCAPLLSRIPLIDDDVLRQQLCTLLLRYPASRSLGTQSIVLPRMAKSSNPKHPALYLIAMNALELRGVHRPLINALCDQVMKMYGKTREGTSQGKAMLRSLILLASCDLLSAKEVNFCIDRALRGDLLKNLNAIAQILEMGMATELKDRGKDLQKLAFECFQTVVPIKDKKAFEKNYQAYINQRRHPESLITYAARMASVPETCAELGAWLDSVLQDRFLDQRYSPKGNPHLAAVYKKRPDLQNKLRHLCDLVEPDTVNPKKSASSQDEFPLSKAKMQQLLIENNDPHLDEKRFPYIFEYLRTGKMPQAYTQAIRTEGIKYRKQSKGTPKTDAHLELLLQSHLIALARADGNIQKERSKAQSSNQKTLLTHRSNQLAKLREANKVALELASRGKPVGQLAADLSTAVKSCAESGKVSIGDWIVSLTDDYWDLLRIGTDVTSSCQNVHNEARFNKSLLGYIVDGKNIPIVIRKPGEPNIVARSLLRVELDAKTQQPALFLEGLYSNHNRVELEIAITKMAVQVAQHLKLPLYTPSQHKGTGDTTLHSVGSNATWVYSDAGGGMTRGIYNHEARLFYLPKQNQCSSSSSSNN